MRRAVLFPLLLIAAVWSSRDAAAASLAFQVVATPPTSSCAAPCYQLRMFYEDPSRNRGITSMLFDVAVEDGATVADLPFFHPSSDENVGLGVRGYFDPVYRNIQALPWSGSENWIVRSQEPGFDALIVAGVFLESGLTVNQAAALFAQFPCVNIAGAPCSVIEPILASADAANRIYLGRFNLTRAPMADAVRLRIHMGGAIGAASQDLLALEGAEFSVPYPAPEPQGALMLVMALIPLALRRRRC